MAMSLQCLNCTELALRKYRDLTAEDGCLPDETVNCPLTMISIGKSIITLTKKADRYGICVISS